MKTKQTQEQPLKTVVICGDDKGGVTKSTTCANVADAIIHLGYKVYFADGDPENRTLRDLVTSATCIDARDETELDEFIGAIAQTDADLTMIDMPGSSGALLERYFAPRGFDIFHEMGIRIVVALTLTQTPDSVRGARAWVKTFLSKAEFITFASERDTPEGQAFSLETFKGGDKILSLSDGRVITIPRFSAAMLKHFHQAKGSPSAYFQKGRAAEKLCLNAFQSVLWKTHLNQVIKSATPHAQWLTGKAIPAPVVAPHQIQENPADTEFLRKFSEEVGM